ncbi:hypothetical protein [Roseibium sediminicola]|uniref:Tetratricopeptide repeat protein n=1 Tax=Roseibium sediminicola TaxID=2933272 RepID=A0ABT0GNY9_9HYPH|nr:hypothetical protein [Roseibium sp. CAU 1639]MCK7611133.1 hypothetical protein [Roseibium sp. CAU 1639]
MILNQLFFWRRDKQLEELSAEAEAGNKTAHLKLMAHVKSGKYTVRTVESSILVDGSVSGSLLIAGNHNTVVQLNSDTYQMFDDLMAVAVFEGAQKEFVERTSQTILQHGGGDFFGDNRLSRLDDVLRIAAKRAKEENSEARRLIYSAAKNRKIEPIVEFVETLLVEGSLTQKEVEDYSSFCWMIGLGEQFRKSIELGLERFPHSANLKLNQISIYDRQGDEQKAKEKLLDIYKRNEKINSDEDAKVQILVRRFLAHFSKTKEERDKYFDEAIEISDIFASENNNFVDIKIEALREAGRDLGHLEAIESFSERDTLYGKGIIASKEGDYAVARQLFLKCLKLDKKLNAFDNINDDLKQLAEVSKEIGDFTNTKRFLDEYLELQKAMECMPGQRSAFMRMAELSLAVSSSRSSETHHFDGTDYDHCMSQAIRISEEIGDYKAAALLSETRDEKLKQLKMLSMFAGLLPKD